VKVTLPDHNGFGSKKGFEQDPLDLDAEWEAVDDPATVTPLPVSDPTSSGSTVSQTSSAASSAPSSKAKSVKKSKPMEGVKHRYASPNKYLCMFSFCFCPDYGYGKKWIY